MMVYLLSVKLREEIAWEEVGRERGRVREMLLTMMMMEMGTGGKNLGKGGSPQLNV